MDNDLVYIVEDILLELRLLEKDLKLNELNLKGANFWKGKNKERVNNLIILLLALSREQSDNPSIIKLIKRVDGLKIFLENVRDAYEEDSSRASANIPSKDAVEEINDDVDEIIDLIEDWEKKIKKKVDFFEKGNKFLKNLSIHKNPNMFYVMVKELNPLNLHVKHPLFAPQAERAAKRDSEELMNYDSNDPISGFRSFKHGDDVRYPGSQIHIITGHHRVYEIYKRYLIGLINGNMLIEFVKDESDFALKTKKK